MEENEAVETKGESERKTLFVRNLPYSTTDKKLEDTFSEYGPIKRCFVVKDRDKEQLCRGFGYVTFVMQEDANKALSTSVQIDNRKVKLAVADKKPRQRDNYEPKNKDKKEEKPDHSEKEAKAKVNEVKEKKETEEKPSKSKEKKDPTKSKVIEEEKRTIILSNLGEKTTKSKLKQLCAKQGKVEKIQYPVEGRTDHAAYVIFKSIKSAVRASQKLNGHTFNDNVISSCLFKNDGKVPARKQLETSQLIVRNLSFQCTEEKLNEAFGKYGQIVKVELPIKVNSKGKKRFLGFGFVQYSNQAEAKKAMDGLNKKDLLGRPMVIDWAVPKDEYQKEKGLEEAKSDSKVSEESKGKKKLEKEKREKKKKVKEEADSDEMGESEVKEDDEDEDDDDESEIKGSKRRKIQEEGSSGEDDDSSDNDEESGDENDEDDDGISDEWDEDEISDEEDDEEFQRKEEERKERLKKQAKDAKEGKTIFMRNLPFEVTEDEIIETFEKYGEIDYCKIVYDQETGHSRGTAFVKYKEVDAADLAVSQSEEGVDDQGIVIGERKIAVMKAVTKGKVKEIEKQKKIAKKDPKDKRNLYLANEGVIFPNSEAAKELSESDLKKREKAWAEKKTKLKNQNYFISKTRLCFRNLPLTVDEKELKDSIKSYCPIGGRIQRALVMRNRERLDKTGKGRSLGFAFVEFSTHEQALAVLRATNNNPDIFGANRRPIVEFSVENQLALNLQKKRLERQKQKADKEGETDKETKDDNEAGRGKEAEGEREARGLKRKRFGKDRRKRKRDEQGGDNGGLNEKGKGEGDEGKSRSSDQSTVSQSTISKRNKKGKRRSETETKKKTEDVAGKIENRKDISRKNEVKNRKRTLENHDAPIKAKKPKKKLVKDPQEEKFNVLVNKYKEKLFGDQLKKKANGKRWFE